MENSQKEEIKIEQKQPQKKVARLSKKSSNKPTGNPMGGRSRAKSTLLSTFEKNLKTNNQSGNNNKKIQVEGFDSERFKNLKEMFEKKPEEKTQEYDKTLGGVSRMDPDRLKAFAGNSQNEEAKKNSVLEKIKDAPRMSIQDRISLLMKSNEESHPKKTFNDPILEKLRETYLDEDEESGDNYSEENLDISKEEEGDIENNDSLVKSESLNDDDEKEENNLENEKYNKYNNPNKNGEGKNREFKENKKVLNKSESLDDD